MMQAGKVAPRPNLEPPGSVAPAPEPPLRRLTRTEREHICAACPSAWTDAERERLCAWVERWWADLRYGTAAVHDVPKAVRRQLATMLRRVRTLRGAAGRTSRLRAHRERLLDLLDPARADTSTADALALSGTRLRLLAEATRQLGIEVRPYKLLDDLPALERVTAAAVALAAPKKKSHHQTARLVRRIAARLARAGVSDPAPWRKGALLHVVTAAILPGTDKETAERIRDALRP